MQTNVHSQQVLQSIKKFFDAESKRRSPGLCKACGSSMQFLDAQFQLYGTPTTWKAWLSFCPTCDSDLSSPLLSRSH